MSAHKLTRGQLVKVVRELQSIIGEIGSAYGNDRAPDRADRVQKLCDKGFNIAIQAIAGDPPERVVSHTPRKIFPRVGIYRASNLPSSHYMNEDDEKAYNCIKPAYPEMDDEQARKCWLADCWIVDKDGNLNPGTANCPVPVHIDNIGRRIS